MELQNKIDNISLFDTVKLSDLTFNEDHNHIKITKVFDGHIYHTAHNATRTHSGQITSVFVPRG